MKIKVLSFVLILTIALSGFSGCNIVEEPEESSEAVSPEPPSSVSVASPPEPPSSVSVAPPPELVKEALIPTHNTFKEANGWSNNIVSDKPQNLLVILANYENLAFKDEDRIAEEIWSNRIFGNSAENGAPTVNDYYKENSSGNFYWKPICEAGNTTGVYSVHLNRKNPTYISDMDLEWPNTLEEFYAGMDEAFSQLHDKGFDFTKYNFDGVFINDIIPDTRLLWISPSFSDMAYIGDISQDFPGGYEDYRKLTSPLFSVHGYSGDINILGSSILFSHVIQNDVKGNFNQANYDLQSMMKEQPGLNPENIDVICHELAHSIGADDLYFYGAYAESIMNISSFLAHFDPYHKWKFNWYQPQEISLEELRHEQEVVRLYPSVSNDYNMLYIKSPDSAQYFLIENRRQLGFDAALDIDEGVLWEDIYGREWAVHGADGVVVWRIDNIEHPGGIGEPEAGSYRPSIMPTNRPSIGEIVDLEYYSNAKDKTDWNTINFNIKIIPDKEYPDGSIDIRIMN